MTSLPLTLSQRVIARKYHVLNAKGSHYKGTLLFKFSLLGSLYSDLMKELNFELGLHYLRLQKVESAWFSFVLFNETWSQKGHSVSL